MLFNFDKKQEVNVKPVDKPKIVELRSVYLHDVYYDQTVSQISVTLPDGSLIRYDLGFGSGSQEKHIKPLHDYEYLVFSSASIINEKQDYEFKIAIEKNIPIIILCHDSYNKNDYSKKEELPFLKYIKKQGLDFKYRIASSSGNEYKKMADAFKVWADSGYSNYLVCFYELSPKSEVLASNKADEPVAWRYNSIVFIPGAIEHLNSYTGWAVQERREIVRQLISFLHNFKPYASEPDWFNEIYLLDEERLINEKNKLQADIENLRRLKRIYFETGDELHNLFIEICQELGIKIEKLGRSDFVIKEISPHIVGEVTGKEKNLTKDKINQIHGHLAELKAEIGADAIKTFVINHERHILPTKRNPLEPSMIKIYNSENINVVSIVEFMKLYEKIKLKGGKKEEMLKLLGAK